MSKNLSQEQKNGRRQICTNILEQMKSEPDFLKKVIICNETWIYQYDLETNAVGKCSIVENC